MFKQDYQPFVSVIMPIRNEADFIRQSLGSVLTQDYPSDLFEVIIADGMSDDNTRALINEIMTKNPTMSIKLIDNPQHITPVALNLALAEAQGEIIMRMDGHAVLPPDYITKLVHKLETTEAVNVGGVTVSQTNQRWGQAIALGMSSPFGVGGARWRYSNQEEYVDTVFPGMWRREVFTQIGNFDEELARNQDDEFNFRLRANGGKILLCPDVKIKYYNRSTPRKLMRQYYQYGFYKARVMQKHTLQMSPRHFVPAAFVASLIMGLIFCVVSPLPLLAVLGSYGVANLGATLWTGRQVKWADRARLPIVFAILHLSYGWGFLRGLVWFYILHPRKD